ncbi:type II secretion system protein [Moritella sp.]|uniref:type II secretion system protein n=1 Tax=Moritella sp. TaxID=78556 RepID=UPI001D8BDED0|nr:type II secretion system protein [Moritella sp.]NQZ39974.1 type II secretion system protein [Moritella sp.]
MKRNAGFTLIELVIVIIVLGILAATAVPKFINLQDDAKKAAMKGVESALHSAANIVYSKAAINGIESNSSGSISTSSGDVAVVWGYPAATSAGIASAVELSGFSSAPSGSGSTSYTFWNGTASSSTDTCVTYNKTTASGAGYTIVSGTCS